MLLDGIKRFPLVRFAYHIPGLIWLYHFSLTLFGALLYNFPSRKIFVVGVTGTKGKTTVLELLNAILEEADKKTALLSSLRIKVGGGSEKNSTETSMPGRFYIQRFLRRAVKSGCKYALIEATSQGVVLSRHRFINWNAGILTNLAPEHIEAHGSFEKYRKAKLGFLRYVAKGGGKVFINRDDKNARFFIDALSGFDLSLCSKEDPSVTRITHGHFPVRSAADVSSEKFVLSEFNKENISAAVSLAIDLGISEKVIEGALRNFQGVPGRMEVIKRGGVTVVVDYAHTPDSLEAVYDSLKKRFAGREGKRLICVLGSAGGGRDKWKRPEMGKIAAMYCDEIILTDEDPYDEDPGKILLEVKSGVIGDKLQVTTEILDRQEAIKEAVGLAKEGDIVVITGKGSEEWIHVARGKKIPWSDKKIVEEALARKQKAT